MLYKKCRHTLTVYCEVHAEKAATAVNRIQNITFTCTAVACLFASLGTIATTAAATSYNKIIQLIIEAIQVIIIGFFFSAVFSIRISDLMRKSILNRKLTCSVDCMCRIESGYGAFQLYFFISIFHFIWKMCFSNYTVNSHNNGIQQFNFVFVSTTTNVKRNVTITNRKMKI